MKGRPAFQLPREHARAETETLPQYVFGQRVMGRNRTVADVAEALSQLGSFRMLIAINSDSHPATEQKPPLSPTDALLARTAPVPVKNRPQSVCQ